MKRMADKSSNLLAALDIGSSKIVCVLAEPIDIDHFRVIDMAEVMSSGVRAGHVVDMNKLVDAIRAVISEIERKSGIEINELVSGVSGNFVMSENTEISHLPSHNEIEQSDVDTLLSMAKGAALPPSMGYLSVVPQEYSVDNNGGIKSPVGLTGSRITAKLHLVTAKTSSCQNTVKALRRNGIELTRNLLFFNPLVPAKVLLTQEEQKLGALIIDIGSELSDACIISDEAVRYSRAFNFGGNNITDEISVATSLSSMEAEEIKKTFGLLDFRKDIDTERQMTLPELSGYGPQPRVLSNQSLAAIMERVVLDSFEHIYSDIKSRGMISLIGHGVVITGGSARIPGIDRLAQRVFSQHLGNRRMNVRIAAPLIADETMKYYARAAFTSSDYPEKLAYCSCPEYTTVIGYLDELNRRYWRQSTTEQKKSAFRSAVDYMKGFFLGNF